MTRYLSRLRSQYDASVLVDQFVLCRDASLAPAVWNARRLGPWSLASHEHLPVVDLVDRNGDAIGWLLGWAVLPGMGIIRDAVVVPGLDAIEELLYRHGGRFAAVIATGGTPRVYLDGGGTLGAVYSPAHEMVASTSNLIPTTEGCTFDDAFAAAVGAPWRKVDLMFGMTLRKGVMRLLPNHYLDLNSWQSVRHWPTTPLDTVDDARPSVDRVRELLTGQLAAVATEYKLLLPLTGGRDSRTVLSCGKNLIDRAEVFIAGLEGDRGAARDAAIARRVAAAGGFDVRVLPYVPPRREDVELWHYRSSGEAGEPRGCRMVATRRALDPRGAEMIGVAAELGRLSSWAKNDREDTELDMPTLIRKGIGTDTPEARKRGQEWLDALSTRNSLRIVDLLLLESHIGTWSASYLYADPESAALRMNPFCHREVLESMMRLPVAYRRHHRISADIVDHAWPELLLVPFDKTFTHHRTRPQLVRQALRNPLWALRKALWALRKAGSRMRLWPAGRHS